MRRRYRFDKELGKLVEITNERAERHSAAVYGDLPGYESPASGKWIDGRKARREDLKRTRCRPWEGLDAEKREAKKFWDERQQRSDEKLAEAAGRAWSEAPSHVRKILSRY